MKIIGLLLLSTFSLLAAQSPEEPPQEECLSVDLTACPFNGRMVLTPRATEQDLLLHFSFDEEKPLDLSGNKHRLFPPPEVGPENGGKGYSAYFDGTQQSQVKHHPMFDTQEFSVCLSMYLLEDSTGQWRTLLRKAETSQQMTPSILLWPKERRLHIRVSTEASGNEGLDSKAVVPLRRWTYLCAIFTNQVIRLYINGILDTEVILKGQIVNNGGDLFVGRDPHHSGVKCFLDDLRVYRGAMKYQQVLSLSANAMGVWGQDFATLGCDSCNYNQALNSCPDNYHLCSLRELYLGGYHIARVMGWFKLNSDIWTKDENQVELTCDHQEQSDPTLFKMALCCVNK